MDNVQKTYVPNLLGIMAVITKKSLIQTVKPEENLPEFTVLFVVSPQKMELYSQSETLLTDVLLNNIFDSYLKRKYNKNLSDFSQEEAEKELTKFLNTHHIQIHQSAIPIDFLIFENVSEEELRRLLEEESKVKSEAKNFLIVPDSDFGEEKEDEVN